MARTLGAPAITGPERDLVRVELDAAGLGPDQADAVAAILGSGRTGDVLIGAAGAGKSHTVGVLAEVWRGWRPRRWPPWNWPTTVWKR